MTDPTGTITVAQAAQALGVSERTVWRYLKSGRLPSQTIGEPGAQRTLIPAGSASAHDEAPNPWSAPTNPSAPRSAWST